MTNVYGFPIYMFENWPSSEPWPPEDGPVVNIIERDPPIYVMKSGREVEGSIHGNFIPYELPLLESGEIDKVCQEYEKIANDIDHFLTILDVNKMKKGNTITIDYQLLHTDMLSLLSHMFTKGKAAADNIDELIDQGLKHKAPCGNDRARLSSLITKLNRQLDILPSVSKALRPLIAANAEMTDILRKYKYS